MFQRLISVLALFCVTACASSLKELQTTVPIGTPFQTFMAKEYLDFAEAEADQYDWFQSAHFAKKGLKFSKGIEVPPELVENYDVQDDVLPVLKQARETLLNILTPENKMQHPKETARAQFMFDCWIEQQEEGWQSEHISYCRENFYAIVDSLYASNFAPLPETAAAPPPPAPEAPVADVADEKNAEKKRIYFKNDGFALDDKARRSLSGLVSRLKDVKKYEITVNGYADRVGGEDHNMKLSRKRAQAVKKMLVDSGITPGSITIFAFGETHNLVQTEDNKPEQENRSVEIVLGM